MSATSQIEKFQPLLEQSADALRCLALNEQIKEHIERNEIANRLFYKVSRRYIAGQKISEALARISLINECGHHATVDYMGESCRDAMKAKSTAEEFLQLINEIKNNQLDCSISLDISHLGSEIDFNLGLENAAGIAQAAQEINQEMIISMEGSDRTDITLQAHELLSKEFDNVGITIQARLHRTKDDLPELLARRGKIRLVKGAYFEPDTIAYSRDSQQLANAYRKYAKDLIMSGHNCSIATHDEMIHQDLHKFIQANKLQNNPFEFETLNGLSPKQLELMRNYGYQTRDYVVYGKEWYLYVCNRIAEQPFRVFQALIDAIENS